MSPRDLRKLVLQLSKKLRHRGPDWSGICLYEGPDGKGSSRVQSTAAGALGAGSRSVLSAGSAFGDDDVGATSTSISCCLAHERLAIIDPDSGSQPLVHGYAGSQDATSETEALSGAGSAEELVLSANGEIYNHMDIREDDEAVGSYPFRTFSDCEVILPLMKGAMASAPAGSAESEAAIASAISKLSGMFAFAVYDTRTGRYIAARDHVGICPLYMGFDKRNGAIWFASEAKAIQSECHQLMEFPPGHFFDR